jgi:hypothetical protein
MLMSNKTRQRQTETKPVSFGVKRLRFIANDITFTYETGSLPQTACRKLLQRNGLRDIHGLYVFSYAPMPRSFSWRLKILRKWNP